MLHFSNLNNFTEISHVITNRLGGHSKNNYESLNLSFKVGDTFENVKANRLEVSKFLKLDSDCLIFPDQCHTANVGIITDKKISDFPETDALITNRIDIGIGVLAADCVPILFYDPVKQVIAAAHAGWKGTVVNITKNVVNTLRNRFKSNPDDIIAGIGPSISQKNYEVDISVIEKVNKVSKNAKQFYIPSANKGHYLLNLQHLNRQLLVECGLNPKNIEIINTCTFENKDFFSARRDGFATGRFGAVITLHNK